MNAKHFQFNLFRIWFGLGAPLFFFGALYLALKIHVLVAFFLGLSYSFRIYHSFSSTCSRCAFYGSSICGLPGKIVPWFFNKNTTPLSFELIQKHKKIDFIFIAIAFLIYVFTNQFLIGLIWPIGAYFTVYKNHQFHGLLHKIKNQI